MNNSILEIIIKARDEASQTISGMTGKLKQLEPQFKTMATAGTVAFGAISAIGIKTIKDYSDAEAAAAQLRHAVIDVTGATQDQLKATEDLADELERKGVLDGDNIKKGLAQLSTFGLSNQAVRSLGKSLSDLAVNQYGVKASGDQLSDSANMIAKALNGQFGVLEKSGIRFTEAQKQIIKYGTELEKVDAINKGFAQNLKYTNDVALQTTEGQLAKAAVSAGNLSEEIGKTLKPVMEQLTAILVPLLQKIQNWIEENPKLTKIIIIAAAAIAGLVAIIGTLGLILPTIIAAFTILAGPVGIIIALLAALWFAIDKIIKIYILLRDHSKEIWDGLKIMFKEAIDSIVSYFQPLIDIINNIIESLQKVGSGIANVSKSIGGKISSAFSSAMSFITGKKAQGGNVSGGSTYLVGENGPELFTPGAGGSITPNGRFGGSGGGVTVNITGGTYLSEDAAMQMGDYIVQVLKRTSRVGL